MPKTLFLSLTTIFTLLVIVRSSSANKARPDPSSDTSYGLLRGAEELTFWSGVSFDSPSGMFIGLTEDRAFFVASLQYARMLLAHHEIGLAYTFDAIPLAVVTNNPDGDRLTWAPHRQTLTPTRRSVYGFGFSPLGMKIYFGRQNRARFFLSASAGFLVFAKEVPEPRARKLNFAFDLGAGLQFAVTHSVAFSVGYKLHHLSNANTAFANPGLDANIFYLGLTSFR